MLARACVAISEPGWRYPYARLLRHTLCTLCGRFEPSSCLPPVDHLPDFTQIVRTDILVLEILRERRGGIVYQNGCWLVPCHCLHKRQQMPPKPALVPTSTAVSYIGVLPDVDAEQGDQFGGGEEGILIGRGRDAQRARLGVKAQPAPSRPLPSAVERMERGVACLVASCCPAAG